MKYRSRIDIVANILHVAEPGAIKTRIMYRAFLSFPQLKEYLELLTDSGLLAYSDEERLFRTTAKGKHLLRIYGEVGQMISPKRARSMMH